MKSKRSNAGVQSSKAHRLTIRDWLRQKLDGCDAQQQRELLYWINRKEGRAAIKWKHASYDDYKSDDCQIFREWAELHGRNDPNANPRDEEKRLKTNFRCALNSAIDIDVKRGQYKKFYKQILLLDKPDPKKQQKKRESNKRASECKKKPAAAKRSYKSRLQATGKPLPKIEPVTDDEPSDNESEHSHELCEERPVILADMDEVDCDEEDASASSTIDCGYFSNSDNGDADAASSKSPDCSDDTGSYSDIDSSSQSDDIQLMEESSWLVGSNEDTGGDYYRYDTQGYYLLNIEIGREEEITEGYSCVATAGCVPVNTIHGPNVTTHIMHRDWQSL